MLILAALLSGALSVTPTYRADADSRDNPGVELAWWFGNSPVSANAFFEYGPGEHYVNYHYRYGSTEYFVPRTQTLGVGLTRSMNGRPWRRDDNGRWYRTSDERMQILIGMQGGGRRLSYVGTEGLPQGTRVFLTGYESTRWFLRPTVHLRLYAFRQAAFQLGFGYEVGNGPKGYRGFQSLVGLSTQF